MEEAIPCVTALIDIGAPPLEPVLERVASTEDESRTRSIVVCGATVLSRILGPDLAVDYVQRRIESDKHRARKERLRELLARIDKIERIHCTPFQSTTLTARLLLVGFQP
jgi:hypothetical protein